VSDTHRTVVLSSAVAANFGQFGARVVLSPFVLAIAATFGQTKADVGVVLTLMWAAYALLQFPSGVAADRYGERPVVLLALALTALGSVLVAAAPSFGVFALAALVLGSGAGLYFAAGTALLERLYEQTGRAFSIHSAGGPLAGLVVPVAGTAVATSQLARGDPWRQGILVGCLVALTALTLVAVTTTTRTAASPDSRLRERLHPRTVLDLLSRPAVAFTTVLGVIGMYVFQSFVSFFPTFLQEYHHLSVPAASQATGVAFVLIAAMMPVVGHLADRLDPDLWLVVPFLVTALGFTVLLAVAGPLVRWAGIGLIGVGLTWGGVIQARFMLQFDQGEGGTGFGLVRTVFVLLGSVGNVATGWLAQVAGWPVAYGVVVGLLGLGAVLVVGNRALGLGL
jgi:YNFM family putative membrane transporter